MLLISGNIDVSIGSSIGVLAVISGKVAVSGLPVWIAWAAPVLAGMAIYCVVGILVAYARIPSIVVTLGLLSILKGGLITVTAGKWISGLPPEFLVSRASLLGLPAPLWFMCVATVAAAYWMANTPFGRTIYAIGSNAEAARAAGVNIRLSVVKIFIIHGAFAGIAAILFATQLQVIQSTVPAGLELAVITASVVGGVSILGGSGTVVGSTLAAILFATIGSSLIFVSISPYWLRAVLGILILATVLADVIRNKRAV